MCNRTGRKQNTTRTSSSICSTSINNSKNSRKTNIFCLQKAAGQNQLLSDDEEVEEGGLALVSAQPFLISFLENKTKTECFLHNSCLWGDLCFCGKIFPSDPVYMTFMCLNFLAFPPCGSETPIQRLHQAPCVFPVFDPIWSSLVTKFSPPEACFSLHLCSFLSKSSPLWFC